MKTQLRNCVIVHGCFRGSEDAMNPDMEKEYGYWAPWVREHLNAQCIKTKTPRMPHPTRMDYEAFKKEFDQCEVNEDTVLVGHSCGCSFLVRWLGETRQRVAKLILVAPWKVAGDNPYRQSFYNYSIDKSVRDRVGEIVIFTADNEMEDGKKSVKMFHDVLGGEVIDLKGRGHYLAQDLGTPEFPELVDVILR